MSSSNQDPNYEDDLHKLGPISQFNQEEDQQAQYQNEEGQEEINQGAENQGADTVNGSEEENYDDGGYQFPVPDQEQEPEQEQDQERQKQPKEGDDDDDDDDDEAHQSPASGLDDDQNSPDQQAPQPPHIAVAFLQHFPNVQDYIDYIHPTLGLQFNRPAGFPQQAEILYYVELVYNAFQNVHGVIDQHAKGAKKSGEELKCVKDMRVGIYSSKWMESKANELVLKCIEAQHLQNDDRERPVEHAQEQFNTWQDRVMGAVDVLSRCKAIVKQVLMNIGFVGRLARNATQEIKRKNQNREGNGNKNRTMGIGANTLDRNAVAHVDQLGITDPAEREREIKAWKKRQSAENPNLVNEQEANPQAEEVEHEQQQGGDEPADAPPRGTPRPPKPNRGGGKRVRSESEEAVEKGDDEDEDDDDDGNYKSGGSGQKRPTKKPRTTGGRGRGSGRRGGRGSRAGLTGPRSMQTSPPPRDPSPPPYESTYRPQAGGNRALMGGQGSFNIANPDHMVPVTNYQDPGRFALTEATNLSSPVAGSYLYGRSVLDPNASYEQNFVPQLPSQQQNLGLAPHPRNFNYEGTIDPSLLMNPQQGSPPQPRNYGNQQTRYAYQPPQIPSPRGDGMHHWRRGPFNPASLHAQHDPNLPQIHHPRDRPNFVSAPAPSLSPAAHTTFAGYGEQPQFTNPTATALGNASGHPRNQSSYRPAFSNQQDHDDEDELQPGDPGYHASARGYQRQPNRRRAPSSGDAMAGNNSRVSTATGGTYRKSSRRTPKDNDSKDKTATDGN